MDQIEKRITEIKEKLINILNEVQTDSFEVKFRVSPILEDSIELLKNEIRRHQYGI